MRFNAEIVSFFFEKAHEKIYNISTRNTLYVLIYKRQNMGIPEEIRKVERPVNTIVYKVKEGTYGVRERAGLKYGPNGKPRPVNGKVVGHIIDGRYVPLVAGVSTIPMFLSYGSSALLRIFSDDVYEDLLSVYPIEAAKTIMVMATLKVIKPSIRCCRYSSEYERTFVSVYYPECPLSKNRISSFVSSVGKDSDKRESFFQKRLSRIPEGHKIAIDGTLKQDSSTANSLSGYSYKSKIKMAKDISVIYAYDIETDEPLCSSVFPGNSIDAASYRQFVTQNSIDKGIIVTDKGFPPSKIADIIKEKKALHFLTPLKRNEKIIEDNDMYAFEEAVEGIEKEVLSKKVKLKDGNFLYSFLDISTMSKEAHDYVRRAIKKKEFDKEKYLEKKDSMGTITLESDLDMSVREAYLCYAERWKIELVFRAYKNDIELRETNVQGDYSVIGMEFVNFVSAILTTRIIDLFRKTELLKNHSYGEIMEDLTNAWRKREDGKEKPSILDGRWVNTLPSALEEMKILGLLKEKEEEKKKRGRPKKKASETKENSNP